jgi:hypothetical protein
MGAFTNSAAYGGQPVFGAIGNTESATNGNFKSTMSPCNNAVNWGSTSQCSKVFGSRQTFNKVYTFNSTITLELQNFANEAVNVHVLDIKVRERQILSSTGLKNIDFSTLFGDIADVTSGSDEQHEYVLSKQLERGHLPVKPFQIIRRRKYRLGPELPSGTNPMGPTGQRNIPNRKTVTIKYNNLKTWNRSVLGSEGTFEGLKDNILDQSWHEDLYTIIYFTPSYVVSNAAIGNVTEKVSCIIRKTVAFGTK